MRNLTDLTAFKSRKRRKARSFASQSNSEIAGSNANSSANYFAQFNGMTKDRQKRKRGLRSFESASSAGDTSNSSVNVADFFSRAAGRVA